MPAIRSPSVYQSVRGSQSYTSYFNSFDERSILRGGLSCSTDSLCSNADSYYGYDAPHAPMPQSINPASLLMSEFEDYERVSQFSSTFSHSTHDDYSTRCDVSFGPHGIPFDYDSSPPSPFLLSDNTFSLSTTLSPSISVTSSSPRSEPGALSPPQEYPNIYEFDHYGASSSGADYPGSWSRSRLSSISHPPSPSFSNVSVPDIKRESSPSPPRGESEKVDRRRFPCLIIGCSRRFTSQYTLKVHMEAHKPKPRVSFPCTEGCSERFSRQHDRLRHEVAKHGKKCEFVCEEGCGRFFSTKKTLGNHKCPLAQGGTRWVSS